MQHHFKLEFLSYTSDTQELFMPLCSGATPVCLAGDWTGIKLGQLYAGQATSPVLSLWLNKQLLIWSLQSTYMCSTYIIQLKQKYFFLNWSLKKNVLKTDKVGMGCGSNGRALWVWPLKKKGRWAITNLASSSKEFKPSLWLLLLLRAGVGDLQSSCARFLFWV